jgi:hypothetical protein
MRPSRLIRTAAVLGSLALLGLELEGVARAAVTCTYDDPTATVTGDLGPSESTVLAVASGAITDDGTACMTATVNNTDTIDVVGSGNGNGLTIDLWGGAFGPGKTAESPAADSEIEFSVGLGTSGTLEVDGGSGTEAITLGEGGINLNATESTPDVDVTMVGAPTVSILGGGGDDAISAGGGDGTGEPRRGHDPGRGPVTTR